jgi:hypothetical protein
VVCVYFHSEEPFIDAEGSLYQLNQYSSESSLSAFLLTTLYLIYLDISLAYLIFPALVEYQT